MKILRFDELPKSLQIYAQIVMALKSLEVGKEDQKEAALQALKTAINGEKCLLGVTRNNLVQFDVNPQAHVEYNPQDCPEIVKAQEELKLAHAKLGLAVTAAVEQGKAHKKKGESIRVEVLTGAKLPPVKAKYVQDIRNLRRKKTGTLACPVPD